MQWVHHHTLSLRAHASISIRSRRKCHHSAQALQIGGKRTHQLGLGCGRGGGLSLSTVSDALLLNRGGLPGRSRFATRFGHTCTSLIHSTCSENLLENLNYDSIKTHRSLRRSERGKRCKRIKERNHPSWKERAELLTSERNRIWNRVRRCREDS